MTEADKYGKSIKLCPQPCEIGQFLYATSGLARVLFSRRRNTYSIVVGIEAVNSCQFRHQTFCIHGRRMAPNLAPHLLPNQTPNPSGAVGGRGDDDDIRRSIWAVYERCKTPRDWLINYSCAQFRRVVLTYSTLHCSSRKESMGDFFSLCGVASHLFHLRFSSFAESRLPLCRVVSLLF